MNLAPQDIFPQIADWIANLDDIFPGKQVKPWFAQWEVGHILSLIVLGGSSILLNLRLIGVGLTDEPPSELHRNMRGWMIAGVIGIVATGLLIGSANAERLYTSAAFSAKMVGLLAGIILTFAITLPATKNDGAQGRLPRRSGSSASPSSWPRSGCSCRPSSATRPVARDQRQRPHRAVRRPRLTRSSTWRS